MIWPQNIDKLEDSGSFCEFFLVSSSCCLGFGWCFLLTASWQGVRRHKPSGWKFPPGSKHVEAIDDLAMGQNLRYLFRRVDYHLFKRLLRVTGGLRGFDPQPFVNLFGSPLWYTMPSAVKAGADSSRSLGLQIPSKKVLLDDFRGRAS